VGAGTAAPLLVTIAICPSGLRIPHGMARHAIPNSGEPNNLDGGSDLHDRRIIR
jgi:hypothetical protein